MSDHFDDYLSRCLFKERSPMNVKGFIICFIFGGIVTFGATYYFLLGPAQLRVGQLRTELSTATDLNRQLTESAGRRQATIDSARVILTSSSVSLDKIRKLVKLLEEYYNNNG